MPHDIETNDLTLFDFTSPDQANGWEIINDVVMGGLSSGEFRCSDNDTAVFSGTLSLENNGGFASTRTTPRHFQLQDYRGLRLRIKGDGKTYQLRLRPSDHVDGIAYRHEFQASEDCWMILDLPFDNFEPVFRGRVISGEPPVSAIQIQQLGFMIASRQAGSFRLEIDWIRAYQN